MSRRIIYHTISGISQAALTPSPGPGSADVPSAMVHWVPVRMRTRRPRSQETTRCGSKSNLWIR